MTNITESANPSPETPSTHSAGEKRYPFILLSAANAAKAISLLLGAGFFSLILLLGMGIAIHLSTLLGGWMVMGLAILMSCLISILTYYTTAKIHHFKEKIFEQTLQAMPSDDLMLLQTQMQKLLKTLLVLQKDIETKEKNSNNHHSPKS